MHKFLLYLLLLLSTSFSQTINFEDALNLTLKNNNKIKSQKLNIESSKIDIKKIESYSYGKIDLSHEMTRTNHAGHVFNSKLSSREATFDDFGAGEFIGPSSLNVEPDNLNHPKSRNNFNTKITYDIPLFTGFKLSNQKDILKLQLKAQNIKLNQNKKSLEYEVLSAYNAAVVAKEFIKATKKAKEAISFFVKSANEFYKEGLVTKIDKKQARVYELNVQSKIIEAENKFDIAIAYLKFLTSDKNIIDVKELKLFEQENKNLNQLYKFALKNRDDLKMLEENKKGMKKNIEISNSSYLPTVYSHLEYGVNDNSISFDSEKDYYLASLGIKYTLFDNTRKYQSQKSKIAFNKTSLNLNQLKDAIKLQVEKATLDLDAKHKIFKEKKEAKELAFEVLEQSKLMYKNQLISMTELLKQEAIFRENEASLIMAKYQKSLALAKLNLSIGKSLKEEKR
ncbi:TolC family protein [Arcobacter sp. LA11]|uniref:TolC family protein n=1 Tax=Arcobacter sp. LA11 TaxID=1898176 RepID=UPI0009347961|nr:TolC family protein [Arcobacter sp. LA11]